MSSTAHMPSTGADHADRPTQAVTLTVVPPRARALTELERVLDRFRTVNRTAKDVVSDARLQQLEWVASELAIALPLGLTETAGDSLADLLAPDAVQAYLALARSGHLRTMPTVSTDRSSTEASERIRIFSLEAIAQQAKVSFPLDLVHVPQAAPRPTVPPGYADLITKHLTDEAAKWTEVNRPDTLVRGLAMWGVMRDALPRLGELESMRVQDLVLTDETRTVEIIRQPQGGLRGRMPEPEIAHLSRDTAQRLADWLHRRDTLIALGFEDTAGGAPRFRGGVPTHLWLSTPTSPDAGLPIHRRGISKWYMKLANAVRAKQEAADVPEEDLVPTRWETMRRTLLAQREAAQHAA